MGTKNVKEVKEDTPVKEVKKRGRPKKVVKLKHAKYGRKASEYNSFLTLTK